MTRGNMTPDDCNPNCHTHRDIRHKALTDMKVRKGGLTVCRSLTQWERTN